MSNSTDKQVWFCEGCQKVGCAELVVHADVFSAIHALKASHRSISPACSVPVTQLRCMNTAMITSKDALIADASIPSWVVDPASQFLGFQQNTEENCL